MRPKSIGDWLPGMVAEQAETGLLPPPGRLEVAHAPRSNRGFMTFVVANLEPDRSHPALLGPIRRDREIEGSSWHQSGREQVEHLR